MSGDRREVPAGDRDVEDLDVPERDTGDVKGGALNAYISAVKGEKQGATNGAQRPPAT